MSSIATRICSTADRDGAAILDITHNQIVTLNATGGFVWERLKQGEPVDRIVQELAQVSDAPTMTGCLEDGDFDILSRNTGELRYAFIQQPNKQFFCFDRAPFKNTDFDDDVALRAILRINEVFFVQGDEAVEPLLQWISKSFHDGGMDSLRYRGAPISNERRSAKILT